jgi:two-component system, cell cycle response regulator CpdR
MAKILVVEDDESVRTLAARALERVGHQVDLAADGAAGLESIRREAGRYDLVISDIRMPMMNGIEMAQSAAAQFPGIRIMLITGFAEQRDDLADLGTIVCDILQKPFTLAEIRTRAEAALSASIAAVA